MSLKCQWNTNCSVANSGTSRSASDLGNKDTCMRVRVTTLAEAARRRPCARTRTSNPLVGSNDDVDSCRIYATVVRYCARLYKWSHYKRADANHHAGDKQTNTHTHTQWHYSQPTLHDIAAICR